MKTLFVSLLMAAALSAEAATPTNDTAINVTLFPGTKYRVQADITTNDVSTLLGLLNSGDNPLQIVDDAGNVLGQVNVPDLIDQLTGQTGAVTQPVEFTIDHVGDTATPAIQRALDSPAVQIRNLTITPQRRDRPPSVRITQRQKSGLILRLRGTASDDRQVVRVEVMVDGRIHRAQGTAKWKFRAKLHGGTNRIMVRAFDSAQHASAPKRTTVRVGK